MPYQCICDTLRGLSFSRKKSPMSIDRQQIEKLATLARIAIDEDTVAEVTARLDSVLHLVDQLQAADTQGVEPMAHPLQEVQRLRDDQVTESDQRDTLQAIAPATEEGLFLVPRVIE